MSLADGTLRRGGRVGIVSCVREAPVFDPGNRGRDGFEALGIPYYYVPFPDGQRPDRRPLDALRAVKALTEAVTAFRPDVLHLHSFSLFPYAWMMRALTGTPILSTIHFNLDPHRAGVRALGALNALVRVVPDGLIALSREQEEQFQTMLHAPADRIFRVPHGIDATHFRPPTRTERTAARATFGLASDARAVALIGRLDALKGHDVLIRAMGHLRDRGLTGTVLLAGTGAGEPEIRRLVEAEGLTSSVQFLGFADSREVLWASDVSVLPSRREAFGLVPVESMLCGVVPIRTPTSGARDQIIDGKTGFITPFDDAEALADRLGLLLADPARRAHMSAAALDRARAHFTADAMITRTLAVYAGLAGRPNRGPTEGARSVPDGDLPRERETVCSP
jgi:glycosyltransferase involved in cell wall biosynthesis